MPTLEAERIYAIDGGYFRAKYIEQEDRFELWTYLGMRGNISTRTGFDIDGEGRLSHRIYDVINEEHLLFASDLTVGDLVEVGPAGVNERNRTVLRVKPGQKV